MMPDARVGAVEAGRPLPVEEVPPGEEQAIDDMIAELKRELTSRYDPPPGVTRRDAHPKHHGLARARFIVDAACPIELRHGIFAHVGRAYAAEIRFSNGHPIVNHDLAFDLRGAGIKLNTGERSLLGDNGQDFLLATGETFFGRDAVDFVGFPKASLKTRTTIAYFLRPHRLRGGLQLLKGMRVPASPLSATYFSQGPYRLGPHCVKYQLRPAARRSSAGDRWFMRPIVRHLLAIVLTVFGRLVKNRIGGFDALRDALQRDLADDHVTLEFYVQRWTDLSRLPVWAIEDPRRRWGAPWVKVATIVVPQQDDATSEERLAWAERMNFNPWRARAEHQPLGGINRARGRIYLEMSTFRNERSGVGGG